MRETGNFFKGKVGKSHVLKTCKGLRLSWLLKIQTFPLSGYHITVSMVIPSAILLVEENRIALKWASNGERGKILKMGVKKCKKTILGVFGKNNRNLQ